MSFPASATMHLSYVDNNVNLNGTGLKRCTSVPSISSRRQAISKTPPSEIDGGFVHSPKNHAHNLMNYNPTIVDESFGPDSDTTGLPSKIFRLSSAPATDNEDEDDDSPYNKNTPCLPEIVTPKGCWSNHTADGTEKNRDVLRKFHALKELLATEAGYLKDLKALVTVSILKLVMRTVD